MLLKISMSMVTALREPHLRSVASPSVPDWQSRCRRGRVALDASRPHQVPNNREGTKAQVMAMGSILRLEIAALLTGVAITPASARGQDSGSPPRRICPAVAAGLWTTAQLVPSPLLVVSSDHVGGGVRWQITPLLYSFGVTARPWRSFVIEPIARHSGSIELYGSPEWACCAPGGHTSWLGRGGARLYLPLIEHGESLSWSLGGSYYRATGGGGGAAELGIYTISGVFGLTVTVSPTLFRREVITALSIRYF